MTSIVIAVAIMALLKTGACRFFQHAPTPDGRTCGWTGCQHCYPERRAS